MTQASDVVLQAPAAPPPLMAGDHAPWFIARSDINPTFKFQSVAGRRIILSFVPCLDAAAARDLMAGAHRFGGGDAALLLVTADRADEAAAPNAAAGVRYFYDAGRGIATLFLGAEAAAAPKGPITYLIDQRLRIRDVVRAPEAHAAVVFAAFDAMAPFAAAAAAGRQAPVLIAPDIFERDFCQLLIRGYDADGGRESGFMIERDGMTIQQIDHGLKKRSDWQIADPEIVRAAHTRLHRRLKPEIARAFQFDVTRIERNTVARYDGAAGGYFGPHRDNTTKGTAHRRFAVSINLNAEDYDGGDLVFPEFGRARFRPPTGGACVFSCSLLHEATPVTRGVRYVYVPFLYDEAAAKIRQQNFKYVQG